MTKGKTRKEKKRLMAISITIIALLAFLVSSVYKDVLVIMRNKKEVIALTNEYENLLDDQKKLSSEVAKMQDPNYIVRYAKEKFLYSADGEIIIRFD